MDECVLERTALALTQRRLEKLAEYEGCTVRLCKGDDCWDGVLEQVDVASATVAIRNLVDGVLIIMTVDPNDWELQVFHCEGGSDVDSGGGRPA